MFLGIDIGTSSVKVLLIDKEGKVVGSETNKYSPSFPKPLWSEQDPQVWWENTQDAVIRISKGYENSIESISLSGQMHGLVTLDANDSVIRPAILWNDGRSHKECDYLNNTIGRETISSCTGNMALTGFTAPKILWMRENEPANFKKIAKIMLPKDYIAYQLTGEFVSDVSDSAGTLYFDVQNRTYSKQMLDILQIDQDKLPKVYESYEVVGSVKSDVCQKLGLKTVPKLVIGGGDNALGAIGTNTINSSDCSISLGTSGVLFFPTDSFVVDEANALHSFCHANGKNHLTGVILNAASAQEWWIKNILNSDSYETSLAQIASTPVEDNLFFLPYLTGERTPINDPNAKGVFYGCSAKHTGANMGRAVLEGVGFALRDTLEVAKTLGLNPKKARIFGGGAKNKMWLSMLANILDITLQELNIDEGPAYGAAILAGVGVGAFASIDEACNEFIKTTNSIEPNAQEVALYNDKYAKFAKIYPTLKELFKQV